MAEELSPMPTSVNFDEIATVDEVARYCKVSPPTIRKWIDGGKLRGLNFGTEGRKLWRIPWVEVRRAFDSQLIPHAGLRLKTHRSD